MRTNKNVYSLLGSSNHSDKERAANDLYTTDPIAVIELLKAHKFNNFIYEPCAGLGHISELFQDAGYTVYNADLIDYGYKNLHKQQDFLKSDFRPFERMDIVTNPPYNQAPEFLIKALSLLKDGEQLAMFLRIQFLEGIKRGKIFKTNPPKIVYVFSKRVKCAKYGHEDEKGTNAICFFWFIWEKGYRGDPCIKWLLND